MTNNDKDQLVTDAAIMATIANRVAQENYDLRGGHDSNDGADAEFVDNAVETVEIDLDLARTIASDTLVAMRMLHMLRKHISSTSTRAEMRSVGQAPDLVADAVLTGLSLVGLVLIESHCSAENDRVVLTYGGDIASTDVVEDAMRLFRVNTLVK